MIILLVTLFGLCVGSFLNVLIDRIVRSESVIKGRSYCESCKKDLQFLDLIPVISFVLLKGKCRYCKTQLSLYYPLVEITTGILFALVVLYFGISSIPLILYYLFLVFSLIAIFFTDLKYGIIPDKVLFPAILVSFVYLLLNTQYLILNTISGVGSFLFFLLLFLITKGRGMGLGDVKYAFFMGLFLGFPKIISGLYVAFLTGALVSLILIIGGKKKFRGSTVPFGPFLVIGTLVGYIWGDKIMKFLFGI